MLISSFTVIRTSSATDNIPPVRLRERGQINFQNIMELTQKLKKCLAKKRAKAIKQDAQLYFNSQVHHCCRVSANNHDIAYLIHRVGIFGGPKVELIKRPTEVGISDTDDFVVVRDGYVYELTRRVE